VRYLTSAVFNWYTDWRNYITHRARYAGVKERDCGARLI